MPWPGAVAKQWQRPKLATPKKSARHDIDQSIGKNVRAGEGGVGCDMVIVILANLWLIFVLRSFRASSVRE